MAVKNFRLALFSACVAMLVRTGQAASSRKLLDGRCAATLAQCGGQTCPDGSSSCSDAAYICCPSNDICTRETQYFWQCQPVVDNPGSAPIYASPSSTAVPSSTSPPPPSPPTETPAATSPPSSSSPSPVSFPSSSPTESSPASSPEGGSPASTRPSGCAHQFISHFTSYWDQSGRYAPDGNYKETCLNIIYDCNTDVLTATCGNNLPNIDPHAAAASNVSSLTAASACIGVKQDGSTSNVANTWGILDCQTVDAGSSSSYLYSSKLDSSGDDAPDGNYKETCKEITYDSSTDAIYAKCGNGQPGSAHAYLPASFPGASNCYQSIANDFGALACKTGS